MKYFLLFITDEDSLRYSGKPALRKTGKLFSDLLALLPPSRTKGFKKAT